jgi:hypothetical protein
VTNEQRRLLTALMQPAARLRYVTWYEARFYGHVVTIDDPNVYTRPWTVALRSLPPTFLPTVSSWTMRRSWVVNDGCVMPNCTAALRTLPASAIAHNARRCLTSSSTNRG